MSDEEIIAWAVKNLDGDELCHVCDYSDRGCSGGMKSDGDGQPVYPPCTDDISEHIDVDTAREVYADAMCDNCTNRVCTGCEYQH